MRISVASCRCALVGAAAAFLPMPSAQAQYEPVIALSGRAGVPVILYGRDVTGAIVEGVFGLARPGFPVTVLDPGPLLVALPPQGAYFPKTGRRPGYGRREVDFPRRTTPAPSYHRSWSAGSAETAAESAPAVATREFEYPPREYKRRRQQRLRGHQR
jgi:hypothetical protein